MKLKLYISSVNYFKQRHPNAIKVLDIDNFIGICRSVPLFSTTSTKEYFYVGAVTKEQLDVLQKSKLAIYVVQNTVDKRSALYKYCNKNNLISYQPELNAAAIKKKYPMLSSRSINTILLHASDFTKYATVTQLLDNLNEVTDDKITWLFSADYEDKIFDALSYLLVGNAQRFYALYTDLINLGESKFKFMVLLYNQIKTLLILKPYLNLPVNEIQNKTGLGYYQVKNNVNIARKNKTTYLRKWLLECGRIERDIKYGKADVDIDLELLIVDILKGIRNG